MNAGFGFVTFADRTHAEATMEAMNGQVGAGRGGGCQAPGRPARTGPARAA